MRQEEKQVVMKAKAEKEYGLKNIDIKLAEKNVFKFFTADKSITYTCHNNGVIDVSERMRRGHGAKSSDSKSDTVSETKTEPKKIAGKASKGTSNADKKPAAKVLTTERRRKVVGDKAEIQKPAPQKTTEDETKPEEDTIEKSQKTKYHFKTGECVKDICGNRKFTVISVSPYPGAIARVRDNDTKTDCTVAVADLVPCSGKPLVLDDDTVEKS